MGAEERYKERYEAKQRRRGPLATERFDVSFGDGKRPERASFQGPVELHLTVTDNEGEIATWLNDDWWTDLFRDAGEVMLAVHFEPSPQAILHPVVIHQIEMLHRVAPHWRVVGYAFRSDIVTDDAIAEVARSAYHEVRVFDQVRPGASDRLGTDRVSVQLEMDEIFGRIRREQNRLQTSRPILVRLPAPAGLTDSVQAEQPEQREVLRQALTPQDAGGGKPG